MTSTVLTRLLDKPVVQKLTRQFERTRQARWAMISQVVTSGANFVTTVLLVRALGLEDFGRFSICFLLTMIVRNFLNGMVLMPMSTIAPKLNISSAPAYRGFLAVNALVFAILSSLLLVAICAPLGWLINAPWLVGLAVPLAFANLTAVAADYMRRFHFVYDTPAAACGVDVVRFTCQLAFLLALVLVWPEDMTPASALYTLTTGAMAGAAFGTLYHGSARWSSRLARAVWPRHWNFIKWMTPGYVLDAIQHNAPLFLGSAILGEAALGLVRSMQQLANVLNLPLNALQQVAPSLAATAFKKNGHAGLRKFLLVMTSSSVGFVLVTALATYLLADIVIGILFDIPTGQALPVLISYFAVNILILLRLPFIIRMQSLERPIFITIASLVGAIAAVAFSYVFLTVFGEQGAPLAAMAALVGNIAAYAVFTRIKF